MLTCVYDIPLRINCLNIRTRPINLYTLPPQFLAIKNAQKIFNDDIEQIQKKKKKKAPDRRDAKYTSGETMKTPLPGRISSSGLPVISALVVGSLDIIVGNSSQG